MSSYGYSQSCALESSLSSALQSHETAYDALSNCVYLFGGGTRFNTIVATIYKRDMSQTNWITLSVSTPTRIKDSSSNYRSGKIYKFDILTENWISNTQLTPPAHPSTYGCLSENGTHLFMVGGQSGSSTNDDYLQMYHINDNSWSTEWIDISPIKGNGWVYQYCHIVGNDLYAFGGLVGGIGRIDNIFKYDPLNKWLLLSSTLPSVASSGATVFKYPYIYLVGGWDGGNALNTIVEFGIDTETITNTYTMRESIHSMGADIINDKVYILGGATGVNNAITNVEQCDILHASTHPSNDPSYPPSKDPSSSPKTSPVETSIRPTYDPSRKESRDGTEPTNESESWTWSVIVWMIIAGVILILIATIIYCKRHPNKDNIIPGPGGMEEAETKQDDKVVALTVRPNQLRKSGSSLLVTSEGPCDNLHNRTVIGDIAKDENKSGDNRNNSDNLDDIYIVGDHGEKSISKSDQNKALHEQRTTEGAKDQKESFHGTKGDYYDEYHHQMYKERIKKK
eukprot:503498_1